MEFTLEKLEVYNIAEKFSDDIWNLVIDWDYFKKDTIGKQFNIGQYCRRLRPLLLQRKQTILFLFKRFNTRNKILVIKMPEKKNNRANNLSIINRRL